MLILCGIALQKPNPQITINAPFTLGNFSFQINITNVEKQLLDPICLFTIVPKQIILKLKNILSLVILNYLTTIIIQFILYQPFIFKSVFWQKKAFLSLFDIFIVATIQNCKKSFFLSYLLYFRLLIITPCSTIALIFRYKRV